MRINLIMNKNLHQFRNKKKKKKEEKQGRKSLSCGREANLHNSLLILFKCIPMKVKRKYTFLNKEKLQHCSVSSFIELQIQSSETVLFNRWGQRIKSIGKSLTVFLSVFPSLIDETSRKNTRNKLRETNRLITLNICNWSLKFATPKVMVAVHEMFARSSCVTRSFTASEWTSSFCENVVTVSHLNRLLEKREDLLVR